MSYKNTEILIATTNPGKIKEIQECLGNDFTIIGLKNFNNIKEVEEDGSTFQENARKKALGYAKLTGKITIADDSGLEIDALNGAPGVHSARFSGEKLNNTHRSLIDHRNIAKVLKLLKNVQTDKRNARFVCSLCMASPEKVILETQGTLEGVIIDEEKGENGFGYDPIFFLPALNKTVAQLTQEEKNSISHRGNAIRNLKQQINNL